MSKPHRIDVFVGRRIRMARHNNEMTQTTLAKRIRVSHQQIGKYEAGENRVSASKLWLISQTLGVRIEWFFEEAQHV